MSHSNASSKRTASIIDRENAHSTHALMRTRAALGDLMRIKQHVLIILVNTLRRAHLRLRCAFVSHYRAHRHMIDCTAELRPTIKLNEAGSKELYCGIAGADASKLSMSSARNTDTNTTGRFALSTSSEDHVGSEEPSLVAPMECMKCTKPLKISNLYPPNVNAKKPVQNGERYCAACAKGQLCERCGRLTADNEQNGAHFQCLNCMRWLPDSADYDESDDCCCCIAIWNSQSQDVVCFDCINDQGVTELCDKCKEYKPAAEFFLLNRKRWLSDGEYRECRACSMNVGVSYRTNLVFQYLVG